MAEHKPTSRAGSLATSLSEKLKIASAKTGGSDLKDLNVAVLKATTSQFHVVPKEKHVRTLKQGVQPGRPHREVEHVIGELHRRLHDATDWLTALKALITLHRLMRESEPGFLAELVKYSDRQSRTTHGVGGATGGAAAATAAVAAGPRLFNMDNFIDRTTAEGRFDFSEWVRAYGKYLDEQLAVYSQLRWYVEQEGPGAASRLRSLPPRDLLFQLPLLQRLQRRLLDCVPRGAAAHDPVVLFSLGLVVKESFKLYKAVSEGIINLADAFFEMEYHDAAKGLELYREGMAGGDALAGYYAAIEQIDEIKRTLNLPKLSAPPPDFLASMEAYVAEAPRPAMAHDGEAPAPAKRGAPLRKGKLLAQTSSARRSETGAAAAAAAAASGGAAPRDPGMVLPVPSASQGSAGAAGTTSAVSSPTAGASAAPAASDGTSPAPAAPAEAAAPPAEAPKPAPSPLDLLSDLDFSFGPAAPAPPAPAAPGASANPFADMAPVSAAAPVAGSNPFGEPLAAAAPAAPASTGFDWPAPAPAPVQPPAWQHQQQFAPAVQAQQQPAAGFYGGSAGAYGAPSDDPFASFGAPSPAAPAPAAPAGYGGPSPAGAGGGAFWGSPAAAAPAYPSAGVPIPAAQPAHALAGNELHKAALSDPFAALTGLPPKSSPGAAPRPSPPRYYGGQY